MTGIVKTSTRTGNSEWKRKLLRSYFWSPKQQNNDIQPVTKATHALLRMERLYWEALTVDRRVTIWRSDARRALFFHNETLYNRTSAPGINRVRERLTGLRDYRCWILLRKKTTWFCFQRARTSCFCGNTSSPLEVSGLGSLLNFAIVNCAQIRVRPGGLNSETRFSLGSFARTDRGESVSLRIWYYLVS